MTGLTGNNAITGAGYRKNQPPYEIDQSLRFENADTASLNRTPSGLGNRRTWTWSGWVKRGVLTDRVDMFGTASTGAAGGAGEEELRICFTDADIIQLGSDTGEALRMDTTPVYRDPSAWYHIVLAMDTTQATDTNRMKLYVNGEQVTALGTTNYPTQNLDTAVNYTHAHYIGGSGTLSDTFDGYLAEVNFIDGQALTPASFGETNSATNQWVPVEYSGSYGTNGFYEKFSSTELANSFTDSGKSALDRSDRESEIAVTSNQDWTNSGGAATSVVLDDLVNGVESNNDAGGGWAYSAWAVSGSYVRFDFGSAKTYSNAEWAWINSSATEGSWKWQGSNNASDWTDIGSSFTLSPGSVGVDSTVRRQSFATELGSNTTAYRYYQILGISGNMNTSGRRLGMYFGGWSDGVGHTITANGDVTNTRAQYKIGSSSIKFDGTGDYLSTPDSDDWAHGTGNFTWEAWVRLDDVSDTGLHAIISHGSSSSAYNNLIWSGATSGSERGWGWYQKNGSGGELWNMWTLDQGSYSNDTWYHVAIVRNGNVFTLYVDGVSKVNETHTDALVDFNTTLKIGSQDGSARFWDGYMDEIRVSNSARYTGAFTPSTTAFTADANTKLLIHSDFNGGLGADSSGNENDFSATNLVATDQVLDSPTNNFATWNPLYPVSIAYSEGNLKMAVSGSSAELITLSTIGLPTSGKWYWEVCVGGVSSGYPASGTFSQDHSLTSYAQNYNCSIRPKPADSNYPYWVVDTSDGAIRVNTTAIASGDVFQHFHDADAGKYWMGINGTYYGIS